MMLLTVFVCMCACLSNIIISYIRIYMSVCVLGTGTGYSVIEMVEAMRKASGRPVPYDIGPRRQGDIAVCYADPSRAAQLLGWKATRNLQDMCKGTFIHEIYYLIITLMKYITTLTSLLSVFLIYSL